MSILRDFTVSYSQNREDLILEAFFPDVENGFYVDVGSNHPVRHSVTKRFYDRGWRGINIEPNPALFALMMEHRPEDTNLNVGAGSKPDKLKFRIYNSRDGLAGLSTFSTEMMDSYSGKEEIDTKNYQDQVVKITTLEQIFAKQNPSNIHFLKVDVEGFEYEVLKGNDWNKYRPEMLCIESNHLVNDWHEFLLQKGYKVVFNDGINDYLLASEHMNRLKKFDYAKKMLLQKPVINSDLAETMQELERQINAANNERSKMAVDLQVSQRELARTTEQRNELFGALGQYSTMRGQIIALLVQTHRRVMLRIDRLSLPKPRRAAKLNVQDVSTLKTEELIEIARDYDQKHLAISSKRSLGRSLAFVLSRGAYKLLTRSLKICYKAARRVKRILRSR